MIIISRLGLPWFVSALLWLIPVYAGAVPTVQIVEGQSNGNAGRLRMDGITEVMLLQASTDLAQWTDILLVSPAFNGIEADIPQEASNVRAFYRLRTLSDPLKFYANKFPGSPHLGSIVSGREVEIQIFGTRDSEGYPQAITSVLYRLGKRHYVSSSAPGAALTNPGKAASASADPTPVPIRYVSGLVVVDLSGDCWPSQSTPVVQYAAREPVSGGSQVHEIAGEVRCKFEFSDSTSAVYSYSAPYYFTYPTPLDEGRLGDAFAAMWDFNSSNVSVAMRGALAGAFVAGALTAPVTLTVLGITAVTSGVVGYAAYTDNGTFDYENLTQPLVATELRLKAIIPNGDAHKIAESALVTVPNPQEGMTVPVLMLEDFCDQAVYFVPESVDQSHLRNTFDYYNSGRSVSYGNFSFIKKPILVNSGDSKYDIHSLATRGSGSGSINFAPSATAIAYTSDITGRAASTAMNLVLTTDGKYDFRLVRGSGVSGGSISLEFRTWGTGADGIITSGGFIYLRNLGTKTSATSLNIGSKYGLLYTSRLSTTSITDTTLRCGMRLEVLGTSRDSTFRERTGAP